MVDAQDESLFVSHFRTLKHSLSKLTDAKTLSTITGMSVMTERNEHGAHLTVTLREKKNYS